MGRWPGLPIGLLRTREGIKPRWQQTIFDEADIPWGRWEVSQGVRGEKGLERKKG